MRLWYVFHKRDVKAALRRHIDRVERREAADEVARCTDQLACDCDSCAMPAFYLSDWDEHEDWLGYSAAMQLSAEAP